MITVYLINFAEPGNFSLELNDCSNNKNDDDYLNNKNNSNKIMIIIITMVIQG